MTTTPQSGYQSMLVARAMKDRSFRSQLIAEPAATIERFSGMKLPEGVQVNVLEEEPNNVYIILPKEGGFSSGEPTDLGIEEIPGFAQANTHVGCGNCSVTKPQTSKPCGCR